MPAAEDSATCDVSVVLPIYNERGHLRAEIDRIVAALEQSEY
ncbi:MAG: glycosyltransferase family 2 protein, partial [Acidimicrobiia bacterium]|nr:glycosyltransferase family 2 protein [Acidimicrobiia bacterium]